MLAAAAELASMIIVYFRPNRRLYFRTNVVAVVVVVGPDYYRISIIKRPPNPFVPALNRRLRRFRLERCVRRLDPYIATNPVVPKPG